MYYALTDGRSIPAERLRWVKQQANGVYVQCLEDEGQGIILENEIYHVSGRAQIDKPTVDLVWQDDVTALKEENELLKGCVMELAELLYTEWEAPTMSMIAELFVKEVLAGNKAMEDVPKGLQTIVSELLSVQKLQNTDENAGEE